MTVEAAFIMPIVLVCIIAVIYSAFYVTDRSVAEHHTARAALWETLQKTGREESAGNRKQWLNDIILQKCFSFGVSEVSGGVEGEMISYRVKGRTVRGAFADDAVMPQGIWDVDAKMTMRYSDPAQKIRSYRRKTELFADGAELVKNNGN